MAVKITKKQIIVPHGMVRKIAQNLHCSERIVHSALKGVTQGKKSDAARRLAELLLHEHMNVPSRDD